jgi:inorganic pyrophosphatase
MKKILLSFFIIAASCNNQKTDYNNLPLYSKINNIQAVIEIPAGTNHKIEYNKNELVFKVDKRNGKNRVIDFLPYPGNYGFIPSTYSNPKKGGDGDALDILVISESLETGTVIEIIPIAVLNLIDDGELDHKIIAVPYKKELQIISATSFDKLSSNYPKVKTMIETWFLNYDKSESSEISGWGNENDALTDIKKWQIND